MGPSAEDFDQVYAEIEESARYDDLNRRHLGLPAEVESSSLLSGEGLDEVTSILDLAPGQVLVDLGCGRGGYGLEIARRTGARLVGVDFSPTAVRRARQNVATFGLVGRAEMRVGTLTETGLGAGSTDAVVCVDAIQFAEPTESAAAEIRRVLRPGGRVVLTSWQSRDPADEQVLDRIRRLDLAAALNAAGFTDVTVSARPGWLEIERRYWAAALAEDAGGDPGIASRQDEAEMVVPQLDRIERVLAVGVRP